MPNRVVEVHDKTQHPLSRHRVVDGCLNFGDGIYVKSIEEAVWYLRLLHSGHESAALELTSCDELKYCPWRIEEEMQKKIAEVMPNYRFELQLDRVVELILRRQMVDGHNPFRMFLENVLNEEPEVREIQFRVFGATKNAPWVSGCKAREWQEPLKGYNVYAQILMSITEDLARGKFEKKIRDTEFEKLLTDDTLFQPPAIKSALIVMDSQGGSTNSVIDGDIMPISGAKYIHVKNALLSKEDSWDDYAVIVVFCGTNCGVGLNGYSDVEARNRQFFELKDVLVRLAANRNRGTVLFSGAFNRSDKDMHDLTWHSQFIEKQFRHSRVNVVTFSERSNIFKLDSGEFDPQLFDRMKFHINGKGFNRLFTAWCVEMPRLRFVKYKTGTERQVLPKDSFEHRLMLPEPKPSRSMGPSSEIGSTPLGLGVPRRKGEERSPLGNLSKKHPVSRQPVSNKSPVRSPHPRQDLKITVENAKFSPLRRSPRKLNPSPNRRERSPRRRSTHHEASEHNRKSEKEREQKKDHSERARRDREKDESERARRERERVDRERDREERSNMGNRRLMRERRDVYD